MQGRKGSYLTENPCSFWLEPHPHLDIHLDNLLKFLPHLEFTARWGRELQAEVTSLQDGVWWSYLWKGYDTDKLTFKAQGGGLVSLCRSLDIILVTWVGWWQFMDRLCPVRHCPGAFCYRHVMDQCLQAPSSGLFYSKEYLTQIASRSTWSEKWLLLGSAESREKAVNRERSGYG